MARSDAVPPAAPPDVCLDALCRETESPSPDSRALSGADAVDEGHSFVIAHPGSPDAGIDFEVEGTDFEVEGTDFEVEGTDFEVEGADFWVEGADFEVEGADFEVEGTDFEVEGTDFWVEESTAPADAELAPGALFRMPRSARRSWDTPSSPMAQRESRGRWHIERGWS